MKKTLNFILVIMVLGCLSTTVLAKDVVTTTTVPEIYDQAIAKAEKQNAIVDTIYLLCLLIIRIGVFQFQVYFHIDKSHRLVC